jgi:hypothetical protein
MRFKDTCNPAPEQAAGRCNCGLAATNSYHCSGVFSWEDAGSTLPRYDTYFFDLQ